MSIFEALKDDHETQRRLVQLLAETSGDSDGRAELFARTKEALKAHAAAEERCFYIPLMEHDRTQDQARHSVSEHQEIEELLAALEEEGFSSPGWLAQAEKLQELVVHHLDEEEKEVFPVARKTLDAEEARRLGKAFEQERARRANGE